MAIKYVKDFEHPESFGFSGSAGKVMVKAYARGGPVRTGKVPMAPKGPVATTPNPTAMPAPAMPKPPRGK